MKILVYEYFNGGGAEGIPALGDVFALGRAMLLACIDDSIAAGHEVYTVAGGRIAADLPTECTVTIAAPGHGLDAFMEPLHQVDAVLPIAPETGGILKGLSAMVESSGKLLLGSSSEAVSLAGDKLAATAAFARQGCDTPATALWAPSNDEFQPGRRSILKPRSGAGCAGIYLTNSPQSIELPPEEYIVQEFVAGAAASVGMIVGQFNHIVLSVNSQNMTFDPAPKYNGGTIPLVHPLSQKAIDCAGKIPVAVPGLRGYVGVDMVFTDDAVYVIEVNPRITFTYCGLRRIVRENLMDVVLKAALGLELSEIPLTGSVRFDGSGRILEEIHPEKISAQVR
jgi:hypothetical protein